VSAPRRVSCLDGTIAGRVRYLRAQRGWSRSRLAREAGVSDGWLSALEQGRIRSPGPRKLRQLAEALGTTYNDVMQAAGYADMAPLPPELRDFVVLLAGMTAFQRQKVLRMLYILLEPEDRKPLVRRPDWIS
jgi:transcriptional regulator with XRE-family HTH domain